MNTARSVRFHTLWRRLQNAPIFLFGPPLFRECLPHATLMKRFRSTTRRCTSLTLPYLHLLLFDSKQRALVDSASMREESSSQLGGEATGASKLGEVMAVVAFHSRMSWASRQSATHGDQELAVPLVVGVAVPAFTASRSLAASIIAQVPTVYRHLSCRFGIKQASCVRCQCVM